MKVRTCRPAVVVSHDITPICRYLRTVRVQRWASLGYSIFSTFFYLFPSDSPHGVLVFSSAIVHVIYMTLLLLLLYHVQANSSMRADARPRLRTCSWWPWEVYNVGKPQKSGWAAKRCTSERSFVKKRIDSKYYYTAVCMENNLGRQVCHDEQQQQTTALTAAAVQQHTRAASATAAEATLRIHAYVFIRIHSAEITVPVAHYHRYYSYRYVITRNNKVSIFSCCLLGTFCHLNNYPGRLWRKVTSYWTNKKVVTTYILDPETT